MSAIQSWIRQGHRETVVQSAVLALSFAAVLILWFLWDSSRLDRPTSEFARTIAVGISRDAPSDTRVFLSLNPWNEYRSPTLQIVLGQSETGPEGTARFRIEFEGFLIAPDADRCNFHRIANTCWTGDGTVKEGESPEPATTVLTGTFSTTGFTRIETSPLLGSAVSGPYRSFYGEIAPLPAPSKALAYPRRGVEAEIATGIGSVGARYESFFPDQPFRLYPDGWAWLLPAPGGPIGMQITDIDHEQRLHQRSDIAGLFMGVFLALFLQIAYELVRTHLPWGSAVS